MGLGVFKRWGRTRNTVLLTQGWQMRDMLSLAHERVPESLPCIHVPIFKFIKVSTKAIVRRPLVIKID